MAVHNKWAYAMLNLAEGKHYMTSTRVELWSDGSARTRYKSRLVSLDLVGWNEPIPIWIRPRKKWGNSGCSFQSIEEHDVKYLSMMGIEVYYNCGCEWCEHLQKEDALENSMGRFPNVWSNRDPNHLGTHWKWKYWSYWQRHEGCYGTVFVVWSWTKVFSMRQWYMITTRCCESV